MPDIPKEPAWEACAGLFYHLLSGRLANGRIRNDVEDLLLLRLLLSDYALNSKELSTQLQADFNGCITEYLGASTPQQIWDGLEKVLRTSPRADPASLDLCIVTTRPEELQATALAFDAEVRISDVPGEPTYVVGVDCAHLPGRRLSVGIYLAAATELPLLSSIVTCMRRHHMPHLVCLVGAARAAQPADAGYSGVVSPRTIYYSSSPETQSALDLASAESLPLADAHSLGLDAYDPGHTGYEERLQALLQRIPTEYRQDLRLNQIRPRFASRNCFAVVSQQIPLSEQTGPANLPTGSASVHVIDTQAYEFAKFFPNESLLIFRGLRAASQKEAREEVEAYLPAAIAALYLRDFLENSYIPPGATDL